MYALYDAHCIAHFADVHTFTSNSLNPAQMTNNLSEQVNGHPTVVRPMYYHLCSIVTPCVCCHQMAARADAPFDALVRLCMFIMELLAERKRDAEKMVKDAKGKELALTPFAQKLYEEEDQRAARVVTTIEGGSDTLVAYARTAAAGTSWFQVDIGNHTCECTFPVQHRLPCRHQIAVYKQCLAKRTGNQHWSPAQWITRMVDPRYLVSEYTAGVAGPLLRLPNPHNLPRYFAKAPAHKKRKRGRAQRKRFASRGSTTAEGGVAPPSHHGKRDRDEYATPSPETKKQRLCSRCKLPGHNIRTCPKPPSQ